MCLHISVYVFCLLYFFHSVKHIPVSHDHWVTVHVLFIMSPVKWQHRPGPQVITILVGRAFSIISFTCGSPRLHMLMLHSSSAYIFNWRDESSSPNHACRISNWQPGIELWHSRPEPGPACCWLLSLMWHIKVALSAHSLILCFAFPVKHLGRERLF